MRKKMTLKEMWKEYLKLREEGGKLYEEGDKLYEEGRKLYEEGGKLCDEGRKLCEEGGKLWDEGRKLYEEGWKLFLGFIEKNYGKEIKIEYYTDKVTLSNGIILYRDGRVYEPFEMVMKEVIKEHEEK
jgi:hypothetical protein